MARHRLCLVGLFATLSVAGACRGSGDASTRPPSGDSASGGLAHVNGATLDATPAPAASPAPTAANGAPSSNGTELAGMKAARAVDTTRAIVIPNPTPNNAGSGDVAPTPDELSALAASLVVPVAGVMPSELRSDFHAPRGGGSRQHNALDIPAPRGTPVISATTGRVLRLFSSKAGGLMVYAADATERFILMYGHLDRYADGLADGARLERGQTIGYVGTTGNAPPNVPHLHFAISRTNNVKRWWAGQPVDPAPLFKR